ncbi:MAG: S8 family serine peptidase [Myxococcaceae bacterium]
MARLFNPTLPSPDAATDKVNVPKVAVIDTFARRPSGDLPHGVAVANVLEANPAVEAEELIPVDIPLSESNAEFNWGSSSAALDNFITRATAGVLDNGAQDLEQTAKLGGPFGKPQIISQSSGRSKAGLFGLIFKPTIEGPSPLNEEGRAKLEVNRSKLNFALGLGPTATDKDRALALYNRIEAVSSGNAKIDGARQRYQRVSEQLEAQNIVHVLAAGNDGRAVSRLSGYGITPSTDFTQNILADQTKVVVAASEAGPGSRIAEFSSPSNHLTVAMDGVGVDVGGGQKMDGTSFSAPAVSGVIVEMQEEAEKVGVHLNSDQVRQFLREATVDTPEPPTRDGAGILDPVRAVDLVRQRARSLKP